MAENERKLLALMDEWVKLRDERERHLEAFLQSNDNGDWVNYQLADSKANEASEAVCDFLRCTVM